MYNKFYHQQKNDFLYIEKLPYIQTKMVGIKVCIVQVPDQVIDGSSLKNIEGPRFPLRKEYHKQKNSYKGTECMVVNCKNFCKTTVNVRKDLDIDADSKNRWFFVRLCGFHSSRDTGCWLAIEREDEIVSMEDLEKSTSSFSKREILDTYFDNLRTLYTMALKAEK